MWYEWLSLGLVPRTGYRSLITINYVSDKPKNGFLEEIIE